MYDISNDLYVNVNGNGNGNSNTYIRKGITSNEYSKSQKTFNKFKSNDIKNQTSLQNENNNRSSGHNWWANKHDEFSQGEKNENLQKKAQNNNENKNVFHGKKKIDYEENVSNSRSYLEEFNVIKIFLILDENE